MQTINNFKIGIVGLGLIGGSLYKNLAKNSNANLYIYTQNQQTLETIISDGYKASNDLAILKECEIIFVCSPISKTADTIKKIFEINKIALFVDVASLKTNILKEIEKLENCKFIGSHPMAGTENSGFSASFAELFQDAKWVITPSKTASTDDINNLKKIINITGATIVEMDATEHDKAVAFISHTPMLLAQSLMLTTINDNNAKLLAASGFRDTTRLAMSNKIMAEDMLALNKENIKTVLQNIIDNANQLLETDFFQSNIENIISERKNLYNNEGKNIFKNND